MWNVKCKVLSVKCGVWSVECRAHNGTRLVLRLRRKMTMEVSKVLRLPGTCNASSEKTPQKYCACNTKRFSTRYETRLNVTKCHACHAKRSNAAFETSKNDPFCRTYHRHGHTALTRTVANGCERLRTVADGCGRKRNVERTHPQPPDPQSETGTLATHSGTILKFLPVGNQNMYPCIWQTKCSPRTRMQSRRTLLWNILIEQSCACFPVTVPVHCRLWNAGQGGV